MYKSTILPPVGTMQQTAEHYFAIIIRIAMLLMLPGICLADPPATVPTTIPPAPLPADFTSRTVSLSCKHMPMSAVIADLAKQIEHNIVVNDEPHDDQADIEFTGVVKDMLDKVTEAYDYTWKMGKSGTILMSKRFSRQMEYPPLNAQELNQTARDTLAILDSFNIDFQKNWNQPALVLAAYEALTPEQSAMLRAGKTISVAQLSDVQKQRIQDVVLGSLLGPRWSHWSMLATQTQTLMNAAPTSYAQLRYYERRKSAIDPSETEEHFAVSARFCEAFEYVVVNQRIEEQTITISDEGFMTSAARSLRNATDKYQANNLVQPNLSPNLNQSATPPISIQLDKSGTMQQRLQTPIHLNLGSTNLKTVVQTLAAQTGLQIRTESYLAERKLVVIMTPRIRTVV